MITRVLAGLLYVCLLTPTVVVLATSFTERTVIKFPPKGFTLRWYQALLEDSGLQEGLWVSVRVGLAAAGIAAVIGTMSALALAWGDIRRRNFLEAFVLTPVTVPNVLIGLALLMVFAQLGLISTLGLIFGHIVIVVPFMVRTVLASLATAPRSLPRAAAVLGATPWQSFRHVTLPLIKPGVFAGAVFTFLISFNNITISVWISSPGVQTLPVTIFHRLELLVPHPTILAVSGVVILGTFALMILLDWRWSLFQSLMR